MADEALKIKFVTQFETQPDQPVEVSVHVFNPEGKHLASAPLKGGTADVRLTDRELRDARIYVAPALPKGEALTLRNLKRMRPYEPTWRYRRGVSEYTFLPIPSDILRYWRICFCRIRGRVVRPVQVGGSTINMPVCNARVRICEVDRWWDIVVRLPDNIVLRWRDEILKLKEDPRILKPPNPPDPPPFRFDPGVRDLTPLAAARMNGAQSRLDRVALNPQPLPPLTTPPERLALNPQPLPPLPPPKERFSQSLQLPAETSAALTSDSATLIRQSLRDGAQLLRPYICYWPFLWPYFCFCDEFTTVITDAQGRFDTWMIYPCGGDHPDLYFSVDYSIGGVWTSVYHPTVCCNTYWNYVCGSEVTIPVHDPRVPWCGGDPTLPGKQVAVLSVGENVSMNEIQRELFGTTAGLTTAGEPFAGSLEPRVWFGDGLIPSGITHYRWSYRRVPVSPSNPPWTPLDSDVVRHYGEELADGTLTFKPFPLGPDPAIVGQVLFKIRPDDPPLNAGAVSSSWAPEVSARANTASAYFPTHALDGGNANASVGLYELKLELFKSDGTRVNLTAEGVTLKTPTTAAPFGLGTVPTRTVPVDAGFPFVPMEDRVIRDGGGNIIAFRFVVQVDNRPCQAQIFQVWADNPANLAGPCGFISYANKTTSTAYISFQAHHPGQHATFGFAVSKGSTGGVAAASASGPVGIPVNLFSNNPATGVFAKNLPVAELLDANGHVCVKAAFAENLSVDATATDGWSRAYWLDADGSPMAFALEPA